MQLFATQRPRFLTGTPLCAGTVGGTTSGKTTSSKPQARRTISSPNASPNSGTGLTLQSNDRLWEIGGRYWWPFGNFEPPSYLDGTLPGDRGFDPLRLGESWGSPPNNEASSRVPWLLEGELYNGRVAMLAVVGILTVEYLGRGPWWTAIDTSVTPSPFFAAAVVGVHLVFALLEKQRIENFEEFGEAGHFTMAPFDPIGLRDDYNRQAEVRNCRTGMLAFLGFAVQAWVTGKGPLENAADHLHAPFQHNIFTYGEKGYWVVGVFTAISLLVHFGEVNRLKARSRGEN